MKKTILFSLFMLFSMQLLKADDDVIVRSIESLPESAQMFIQQHFPNEKMSYIKIDKEFLSTTYEVVFISRTKIEFLKDGRWKKIECKNTEMPDKVIPQEILEYVKRNFPDVQIKKIEKEKRGYELELSNKLDLEFDLNKKFIRIDD